MSPQKIFRMTTGVTTLAASVMLLGMAEFALAGTTVRDHRGPTGAPQGGVNVGKPSKIVPGPIGGPKWKGGYDTLGASGEKGAKSGVTVRDHR
jgi:hypothetical protein